MCASLDPLVTLSRKQSNIRMFVMGCFLFSLYFLLQEKSYHCLSFDYSVSLIIVEEHQYKMLDYMPTRAFWENIFLKWRLMAVMFSL